MHLAMDMALAHVSIKRALLPDLSSLFQLAILRNIPSELGALCTMQDTGSMSKRGLILFCRRSNKVAILPFDTLIKKGL